MGILLAFAPFIAFAIIDRLWGPTQGLVAGAVTSVALIIRDRMSPYRKPKILEIGTAILFAALAIYAILGGPAWSIIGVRLRVDAGLLLIVLVTIVIRTPFTVQYAREEVAKEFWSSPRFIATNYAVTAVWAAAFAILVAADLLLIYRTDLSPRIGIVATILALAGAAKFTQWYPDRNPASVGR